MASRRNFLKRMGAAAVIAPVAVVTATSPAQGAARPGGAEMPVSRAALPSTQTVVIRGGSVVTGQIFDNVHVVLDGSNIHFEKNWISGSLTVTDRSRHIVMLDNFVKWAG